MIQQSITYEISNQEIPMSFFLPYKRYLDIRRTCTEVDGWRFDVTVTIKFIFMKRAVEKLFTRFQGKQHDQILPLSKQYSEEDFSKGVFQKILLKALEEVHKEPIANWENVKARVCSKQSLKQ